MRWIVICLLVGVGYWYIFGMNQGGAGTAGEPAGARDEAMRECMAKKKFAASRLVSSDAQAQSDCATELNLYHEGGHWFSYDEVRR